MNSTVSFPIAVWTFTVAALLIWALIRPRDRTPWKVLAMIAVFAIEPFSARVMDAENHAFPQKYDHFLQAIDQALGITAFGVARVLATWQKTALFGIYESLTFAMIAWFALHLKLRNGSPRLLIYAYLLVYCLGPALYLIVPACGPRHAFPAAFPGGQPSFELSTAALNYWPNAMPSLHMATALLFVFLSGRTFLSGRSLAVRAVAWVYLAGTILGTLAFEHYVIDLVVAIPFACFAVAAAEGRLGTATGHFAFMLAWLLLIRMDTPLLLAHPYLLRVAALLTVAAGVRFGLRTERAGITRPAARDPHPAMAA